MYEIGTITYSVPEKGGQGAQDIFRRGGGHWP